MFSESTCGNLTMRFLVLRSCFENLWSLLIETIHMLYTSFVVIDYHNSLYFNIFAKLQKLANDYQSFMYTRITLFSISGELFIFYSIFYVALAVLFAICMQVLLWTIDEKIPKWKLDQSRIGNSPGLGFRPMPMNASEGSLIWLKKNGGVTIEKYIASINNFLKRKFLLSTCNLPCLLKRNMLFENISLTDLKASSEHKYITYHDWKSAHAKAV